MTKAKEIAAWIIRSYPSVQSIADRAYAQGLAQVFSEHEYAVAKMAAQAITRECKFLPSISEAAEIAERLARNVENKRRRESDEYRKLVDDEKHHEQALDYLKTWINANTAEPWYCQRVVDITMETGAAPIQVAGAPGQRIWLTAFLEGWHRKLERWVLDEAARQASQYPDFPIEVLAPPADVVKELRT